MGTYSFEVWLQKQLFEIQMQLLVNYEERNRLLYEEGIRLENEYMKKIGSLEETVILEEIEVELLNKKRQILQIALNRREQIEELKLEAMIEAERKKILEEAEGSDAPKSCAQLTEEEEKEWKALYKTIRETFHPGTHKMTSMQCKLYDRALLLYQYKDLPGLKLIYEMLIQAGREDVPKAYDEMAQMLFSSFIHTKKQILLLEDIKRCRAQIEETKQQILDIKEKYPYSEADFLADDAQVEAYRQELSVRLNKAKTEQECKQDEITAMSWKKIEDEYEHTDSTGKTSIAWTHASNKRRAKEGRTDSGIEE